MKLRLFSTLLIFTSQIILSQSQPIPTGVTDLKASTDPGHTVGFNSLVFDYDTAGNQIKRTLVYLAARLSSNDNETAIETEVSKKEMQPMAEYPGIKYYPNPVKSELYLDWSGSGKVLENIEIYDLNGKLIKSFLNQIALQQAAINFESFSIGIYNMVLVYTDTEKQTFKIVKQ